MAKGPALAKVFDAFATAALEQGVAEDCITVGQDDDGTVHLLLEAGERSGSVRVEWDGIPSTARALEGLAQRAARTVTAMLMPAPPLTSATETITEEEPVGE